MYRYARQDKSQNIEVAAAAPAHDHYDTEGEDYENYRGSVRHRLLLASG